ncbi:LysR family transcriptional regulator [Pigmentiphaga sp.]|uniref:LysR family transcriptional regulator n=1 Tax=Pigmentiphaga sp. TaxID=1977564 RepID=UPI00128E4608|nr:LysR family transcriptional regulator [Pigmentiphaga sp.]MPS28321.1 LysR family transcriptional regulator [Alcaligenaceae bacterium SAGV5]MPS50514.1 LysR family transcriptional regulator [Alcaligenaceae bacterium SAGV3]MPT58343.1 LysR family transcriptional regulator [Alcaligenaceae bacterium]
MSDTSEAALRADWYLRGRLRLRHLRLLVVMDDVRNVGEAARRMATTQPAVSRMLAELEDMVGARLFERTSKGTFPTVHGASMIRHARWVLGDLERMGREWSEPGGLGVETLSLGINSSSAAFLVPRTLLRLEERAAGINVLVREGSIEALLPDLQTRKLDLVVARLGAGTAGPGLATRILCEEPMCVCGSASHPLASRKRPSWKELAAYPWIMPPRGSPVRAGLDMLFQRADVRPASRVESASVLNNMVLMDNSHALSVMPRAVAAYHARRHALAILAVELPPVFGPIGVIRHDSLEPSPAMLALVDCLEEEAKALSQAP